jgi:hypothetical protein
MVSLSNQERMHFVRPPAGRLAAGEAQRCHQLPRKNKLLSATLRARRASIFEPRTLVAQRHSKPNPAAHP